MQAKTFNGTGYTLDVLYHLGHYENSIHFIFDDKTKTCAIVDPAWDADLFIAKIQKKGYQLTDIWLTHWHSDHTNAVDEIVSKTNATVTAGTKEEKYLKINANVNFVNDNDIIAIGATKAKIISTPGHTAGGVCYLLENNLIAGDVLFVYGAGHCIMQGANAKELFQSMQKLKQVKDDILLHCGHDYGAEITTSMAVQKKFNPFLLIENEQDFVRYRNEIHDNTRTYPMQKMTLQQLSKLL